MATLAFAWPLLWATLQLLKIPQRNPEIGLKDHLCDQRYHRFHTWQSDRIHQRLRTFSTFNHIEQLQRRAEDKITSTQTTKPSLQRIASSPSFYCHSRCLSFWNPLDLFILLCRLPPVSNNACWGLSASYKEYLGTDAFGIPPKQIRNVLQPKLFFSEDCICMYYNVV